MNLVNTSVAFVLGVYGIAHAQTRSLSIHSEDSILSRYITDDSSISHYSSLNSISSSYSGRSSTEEVIDKVMIMLDAYDIKFVGMKEVSYEEAKQYLTDCCYLTAFQADTFLVYVNKALEDGADSDTRKNAIYGMLHNIGSVSLNEWIDQEEHSIDAGSWEIKIDESTGRLYIYFKKLNHCFPVEKGRYFYLSKNYIKKSDTKVDHMQIRFDLTLNPKNGQVYDQSGNTYSDRFQGIFLPNKIFRKNVISRRHSI